MTMMAIFLLFLLNSHGTLAAEMETPPNNVFPETDADTTITSTPQDELPSFSNSDLLTNPAATNSLDSHNTNNTEYDSHHPKGKDCLIPCHNGGVCQFVADKVSDIRHVAQQGGLIQRCLCPPGFGGVACEIPIEECNLDTLTCPISGLPCERLSHDREDQPVWTCHCHLVDQVDPSGFSGTACRRGYTEYCSDYYDPHAPLYFCTNGGKCLSDYLSAQEAPGDYAVRRQFMDQGCVCNDHWEGARCEKFRFKGDDLEGHLEADRLAIYRPSSDSSKKMSPVMILCIGVGGGLALAAFLLFLLISWHRRRRKRRQVIVQKALICHEDGDATAMIDEVSVPTMVQTHRSFSSDISRGGGDPHRTHHHRHLRSVDSGLSSYSDSRRPSSKVSSSSIKAAYV